MDTIWTFLCYVVCSFGWRACVPEYSSMSGRGDSLYMAHSTDPEGILQYQCSILNATSYSQFTSNPYFVYQIHLLSKPAATGKEINAPCFVRTIRTATISQAGYHLNPECPISDTKKAP